MRPSFLGSQNAIEVFIIIIALTEAFFILFLYFPHVHYSYGVDDQTESCKGKKKITC